MPLRELEPDDVPHLLRICRLTGDSGRDATATFSDPDLVGQYFAAPYAAFDPRLCLILEEGAGPVGYVVGAADTAEFGRWFNREWLPPLREAYRGRTARVGARDAWLFQLIEQDFVVPSWAGEFPAHLHIDLLPAAQGRGWGRRMILAWCERAAARGARGVHLGVAPENDAAIGFYSRLGFRRLPTADGAVVFGHALPWREPARA